MSIWRTSGGVIIRDGTSGDIERCAECPCEEGNDSCLNHCTNGAPSQLQLTISGFSNEEVEDTCDVDPLTYYVAVLNGTWLLDLTQDSGGVCVWSDTYTPVMGSCNSGQSALTISVTMASDYDLDIRGQFCLTNNPLSGSSSSCDDDNIFVFDSIADWSFDYQDCFNISESGTLSYSDSFASFSGSWSLVSV